VNSSDRSRPIRQNSAILGVSAERDSREQATGTETNNIEMSLKRLSQRLRMGGAGGPSLSKPVVELSDEELVQRSSRIVRFQGVALSYLVGLRNDVQAEKVAPRVDLYVAKVDLSAKVKKGMTIRMDGQEPDERCFGEVAYVEGKVYFRMDQVEFKPRSEWTTEDVTEQHILSITSRQKTFMLDQIGKERVGPSFKGAFVSQARKCKFSDLVEALENHYEGRDWDTMFIWVDFMSANQPLLTNSDRNLDSKVIQERYDLLNQGLHEAIKRFEERLIFFDSWNDPTPLKRSWCVWEILGSVQHQRELQAVFAPGQDEAFLEVLLDDADQITQRIVDMDTRKATCFKKEDQAMITEAIEKTLRQGFVTLNAVILQCLRTWLTEITHVAVEKSRRSEGRSTKHALTCNQAGLFLKTQGVYEKALRYLEEALDVYNEKLGGRHPFVAATLNNIARIYDSQGVYEKALQYYVEALDILREELGDQHHDVGATLNNIALVNNAQGSYEKALQYFEEALGIFKEALGERHPNVALTLNNIAGVFDAQGSYEKALQYNEEALDIWKASLGNRHPSVATTLNNIARVHKAQGAYEKALRYYRQALDIRREKLGDRHPDVATTLNNIGWVHRSKEDYARALNFFREAYEIDREKLGDEHPSTKSDLESIQFCESNLK